MLVTEHGAPENEAEHVAIVPAPVRRAEPVAAPAASASPKLAGGSKSEAGQAREREEGKPSEAVAQTSRDGESKGSAADADPLPGALPTTP